MQHRLTGRVKQFRVWAIIALFDLPAIRRVQAPASTGLFEADRGSVATTTARAIE